MRQFKPFVCALKSNQKSLRCDFCFKSLTEDSKNECNVCHKYWYCNDICLNNDSISHRIECDPNFDLIKLISEECTTPERVREESDWTKFNDLDEYVTQTLLLLRILFKLKSDPKSATNESSLESGQICSYQRISVPKCPKRMHRVWDTIDDPIDDSQSTEVHLIDGYTYNFGAWLSTVRQVLQTNYIRFKLGSVSEEDLIKAFKIVIRYTLYVCDMAFLNVIGKAIYVEMCFIKHSCIPNSGPLFEDSNVLNLRLLDNSITDFSQITYDFQIEMSAYSGPELSESLIIRDIDCKCKLCSDKTNQFNVNYHKLLTNANLRYGNWLTLDYCHAMSLPIDETLDYMFTIYGKYHPLITGILLWKFRNQWLLFNGEIEDTKQVIGKQVLDTFSRLKDALNITHGLDHIWSQKLNSIEDCLQPFINSVENCYHFKATINQTIEQIIPRSVIEQKLY